MVDFEREGVFLGNEEHQLGLVRIDSPVGDFCYEPNEQRVGMIVWADPTKMGNLIHSAAKFISQTQELLPEELVAKVLNMLPYKKKPPQLQL